MAYSWRRDKGRLDHTAHKEIADPAGIFTIGFVPLLRFGVLGMRQGNLTGILKCIEDRDPVLTGGFHTYFCTIVFMKPVSQTSEIVWKRREASFMVIGTGMGISNPDTGVDPGFVDIQSTAVVPDDFEHGVPPAKECRLSRDWLSGEIETTSEEISLRATFLRQSLMP